MGVFAAPSGEGSENTFFNRSDSGAPTFLGLSTDPFMVGHPEIGAPSLAIVERLTRAQIPCSVLTKGILPSEL
jgi:hypothetical protein